MSGYLFVKPECGKLHISCESAATMQIQVQIKPNDILNASHVASPEACETYLYSFSFGDPQYETKAHDFPKLGEPKTQGASYLSHY